jgi:hypothetical protein
VVLTLQRCRFFDNEMGLLAANLADAELAMHDCDFGDAPRHDGPAAPPAVRGPAAQPGADGQPLRQRLARSPGEVARGAQPHRVQPAGRRREGECSYELDLPDAGLAWVLGNVLGQGPRPQNTTLLAYGAERNLHADNALFVAHNSFSTAPTGPATWVRHWPERLPAGSRAAAGEQPAARDGGGRTGPATFDKTWPMAAGPAATCAAGGPAADRGVAGAGDCPQREITEPVGRRSRAPTTWRPGFQN